MANTRRVFHPSKLGGMSGLYAFIGTLLLTSGIQAADWPQWLGVSRDGHTSEAIQAWDGTPPTVWTAEVGLGFSSPVVAAGRVYVHAQLPGKEREELIGFDAKTGEVLWRTAYDRPPYKSALNTGPRATPTVAGGRVYSFGISGMLSCFAAETGKRLWQVDTFDRLKATLPQFGVCCSPVVIGNRVVVAVGGKGSAIAAFDTDTGELVWQNLDEPANTASPILFTAKGKLLPDVVFMTSLRVVGVNPLDGTVNWEFPLPFQPSGAAPTPILAENLVVTSTRDNGTTGIRLKVGPQVMAEKAWQGKDLSGYFSTGVAAKDRLFLVRNTLQPLPRADLVCVELATGKPIWNQEGVGYFHFGTIATANDRLLILDDAGNLKLIDAAADGYRELCQAKICDGNLVTPAFANGCVYARDGEKLVCVRLAE